MDSKKGIIVPNCTDQLQELIIQAGSNNQKIMLKENLLIAPLVPDEDTIIVDLANINQLVELDKENCTLIVEGGINFLELQQKVAQEGFIFPIDTFASEATSLAYNVIHNLPSYYLGKYGNYREYVVGMEAILCDGSHIKLGGKNIKNVSGLDIMGLLIGSKETLGIITKLVLRLLPAPEVAQVIITPFDNLRTATEAAAQLTFKGSMPAKLAIINEAFIATVGPELPVKPLLLAEFDGFRESLPVQMKIYKEIVQDYSKYEWIEVVQAVEINKLWQSLRSATTRAFAIAPNKLSFSSYLTKLSDLGEQFDQLAEADWREMGIIINGAVGAGVVVPLAGENLSNDNWLNQAINLVAQCDGNMLNTQSFSDSGMKLIQNRLLQIFNPNNISFNGGWAKGGN
jgi:glycolate oxidase